MGLNRFSVAIVLAISGVPAMAADCETTRPGVAAANGALPAGWTIQPATSKYNGDELPNVLRVPLLSLGDKPLNQVQLLVALPFEQVLPAVRAAITPLGRFEAETSRGLLSGLGDGWGAVMMANHPEYKTEFVRRYRLPDLQQAVADGALLAEEIPLRVARLEEDRSLSAQTDKLDALKGTYTFWSASAKQNVGALGRVKQDVVVRVIQVDAAVGHPATAVILQRDDDWPNPKGGLVDQLREFNVMGGGPSPRLSRSAVPMAVFQPLYTALKALPQAKVELGAGTCGWMPPQPPPRRGIVEPQPIAPEGKDGIEAQKMLQIQRALAEQTFEVSNIRPMSDGSVLLVQANPFSLMRWKPGDGTEPQRLWKGSSEYVSRWLLSGNEQGTFAYLTTNTGIVRYDVATAALTNHPLQFDDAKLQKNSYLKLMSDGSGTPWWYYHDVIGKRDALKLYVPTQMPAAEGEVWRYGEQMASPRQDMMRQGFPGNTQSKPVRWDGMAENVWVEDAAGLAELSRTSGKVLRVLSLPRRFGSVDPYDDAGMAQWVPEPLGSVAGKWIAVGFVLMKDDVRYPGMHVISVPDGKVLRSLMLPRLDSLKAAVGSHDGRFLALGAAQGDKSIAALWNLKTGRSLDLRSSREVCWDLRQLQWSPDGAQLWGLCGNALVRWSLPEDWRSAPAR